MKLKMIMITFKIFIENKKMKDNCKIFNNLLITLIISNSFKD